MDGLWSGFVYETASLSEWRRWGWKGALLIMVEFINRFILDENRLTGNAINRLTNLLYIRALAPKDISRAF